jgi:hypothetical protein
MSSQLRKLKEKIENKNKKPRKAPVYNRDDGPQCDKCLRRFSSNKRSLRNHKARIHDGKTSKDFECLKCHKKFSAKSQLEHCTTRPCISSCANTCAKCAVARLDRTATFRSHIRMQARQGAQCSVLSVRQDVLPTTAQSHERTSAECTTA